MATRNFLNAGLDLTGQDCIDTSELLQSIQQANPVSDMGWIIKQESTPDVGTYTELARFLWLKTSTRELYAHNGTSWELVTATVNLTDQSVAWSMIAIDGDPRQIVRISEAGDSYEPVDPVNIFNDGELPLDKLEVAAGAGYVIYSTTGGEWTTGLLSTLTQTIIGTTYISPVMLKDLASSGTANQVPYLTATGAVFALGKVENLCTDNSLLTKKLSFAAGAAGKVPVVNAGGTDFDYQTLASLANVTAAQIKYTGAVPFTKQSFASGASGKLSLNAATSASWLTFGTNEFTLESGTYIISAVVPVTLNTNAAKGVLALRSSSSTIVESIGVRMFSDSQAVIKLEALITVTASTLYDLFFKNDGPNDIYIGHSHDDSSYPETYVRVLITRIGG